MRIDGDQMWALLKSLDDPEHLEFPADYSDRDTRSRFDQLVARLNTDFSCWCDADRNVQDASLHARVDVPAEATATGEPLIINVSNFGNLAVIAVNNPGVWTRDEFEELLAPHDAERVYEALDALGYAVIPEEPLWSDYQGPSRLTDLDAAYGTTWWTRFFDYL